MDGVSGIGSFSAQQAARAYGAGATNRTQPVAKPVEPAQAIRPAPARAQELTAAKVPGGVGFEAVVGESPDERSLMALYTRPADRSEAATRIQLGRVLDVEG